MKLADFDFRLALTQEVMADIVCDNKDCPCQEPFLYGERARNHFNDPLYKDCEVELWSGFHDKNGTKIYEGDIVKYQNAIIPIITREDFPTEVYRVCEVIGNIHENADLLEYLSDEEEQE